MTRTRLALLAALALVAAVASAPAREIHAESLYSAVSRSLGGMRVFIVDIVYLRAEQARAEGDLDDARSLYETLLRMQPDNAPAAAHLVGIEFDLLSYVLDDDERFERWRKLRATLGDVIELRPDSARLRYCDAQLILDLWQKKDAALQARVTEHLSEPRFVAMMRLAEASILAHTVLRVASTHLERFVFECVYVAADTLARKQEGLWRKAVSVGREVLAVRDEMLRLQRHAKVAGQNAMAPGAGVTLRDLLRWGLDTVEAVAAAPTRQVAEQAVALFVQRVGEDLKSVPLLRAAAAAK